MADLFVFAETKWENPEPESGTRTLAVWLGSYQVADFQNHVCFVSKGNPSFLLLFYTFYIKHNALRARL